MGRWCRAEWRGGLPITYKTGPSVAKAHLALAFNWDRKPLYDVVRQTEGLYGFGVSGSVGDPGEPPRCVG